MGFQDRDYYRDARGNGGLPLPDTAHGQIVLLTVIVFVADIFTEPFLHDLLKLQQGKYLIPWQAYRYLTYGFMHAGPGHLLFNMLAVWIFGRLLTSFYSVAQLWRFYLFSLVFSAVGYFIISSLLLRGQVDQVPSMVGASGGVMAIMMLAVYHVPRQTFLIYGIFPVELWVLAAIYVAVDVLGMTSAIVGDNVAYAAHLSGATFGAFYGQFLRRWDSRIDWGFFDWKRWRKRSAPRLKTYRPPVESETKKEADSDTALEKEVDRILLKVQEQGRASLTAAEQQTLETASRHYRAKQRK